MNKKYIEQQEKEKTKIESVFNFEIKTKRKHNLGYGQKIPSYEYKQLLKMASEIDDYYVPEFICAMYNWIPWFSLPNNYRK